MINAIRAAKITIAVVIAVTVAFSTNAPGATYAAPPAQDPWSGPTDEVFADLINRDNLVRVWRLDNATGNWQFYDPRLPSTLDTVSAGDIVWLVIEDRQQFHDRTLYPGPNVIALAPLPPNPASGSASDVFAELTSGGNLVTAWRYDNPTGNWALYHSSFPAHANDLSTVSTGDVIVIITREQRQFQGQTLYVGTNLIILSSVR